NQWSITVPVKLQTATETIAEKAVAYGFPGVRCDGNDILDVYEAVRLAAERARAGEGPTLVECLTYRILGHTTSDDPTRYRDEREVEPWRKRDPIILFEKALLGRGVIEASEPEEAAAWARALVDDSIAEIEKAPPPPPSSIIEDVTSQLNPRLRAQFDDAMRTWKPAPHKH
ncbi:MAG: thiamine pyrophosphate-dependent enzyme, partial [Polyangiaceae bacterium]